MDGKMNKQTKASRNPAVMRAINDQRMNRMRLAGATSGKPQWEEEVGYGAVLNRPELSTSDLRLLGGSRL